MSSAPSLYAQHQRIALKAARLFYLPGSDHSDVLQEARIALWDAARRYDREIGPFPPFARTVVHRHLTSCLRFATRDKQLVLTEAGRDIDAPTGDTTLQAVIVRDRLASVVAAVRRLSPSERITLRGIIDGDPILTKRDDNARYLLREKLRAA